MKRTTPANITQLRPNEVFVFGSNTKGIHGSGAARTAQVRFGAKRGLGEGFSGQSYAFPTLSADSRRGFHLEKRTDDELIESANKFLDFAEAHPEMTFLLTKVGCGLAGYPEEDMKALFDNTPPNVVKPEGW